MVNEAEPTSNRQPTAAAFEALGELLLEVQTLLGRWKDTRDLPPTLYHFTDCAGLIGILQTRKLWASLSTALNDASEGTYAPMQLAEALRARAIVPKTLDPQAIVAHCCPERFSENGRVFVSSFCGAREAAHWLHYGRAGTGVAIGFDAISLYRIDPFILYQVRYRVEEQWDLLRAIMMLVDDCAAQFASEAAALDMFAQTAATMAGMVAPWMKHPAFASEDEWRLIGLQTVLPAELAAFVELMPDLTQGSVQQKAEFRSVNNRIVPYVSIPLPLEGVRHIELGAACPISPTEQSLRFLRDECVGRDVSITRSDVLVRP